MNEGDTQPKHRNSNDESGGVGKGQDRKARTPRPPSGTFDTSSDLFTARVLSTGVSASIFVLCIAVVFLLIQPVASMPPVSFLLELEAWRQPGAPLLWLTLLTLGLTPLAALVGLIIQSTIKRQRVELILSLVIFLLIVLGSYLGSS